MEAYILEFTSQIQEFKSSMLPLWLLDVRVNNVSRMSTWEGQHSECPCSWGPGPEACGCTRCSAYSGLGVPSMAKGVTG